MYEINTNYVEILAGTGNRYNPLYEAVSNDVDKNNDKGLGYLKNFLQSIENVSSKESVKDERITKSAGNIRKFEGHNNIVYSLDFLNKNLGKVRGVGDCQDMYDILVKYQPQFTEAYEKKMRLVMLEYESAVYMLVTNLSMILANNMEVVSNGTEIRIKAKSEETFGTIPKMMGDLVKQMKDPKHKSYLDELNKMMDNQPVGKVTTEGVYVEFDVTGAAAIAGAIGSVAGPIINSIKGIGSGAARAVSSIRKSLFGIVPLIRGVAYLRYKRKADTIIALDQQVAFIQNNINQLEKRTNINPAEKEKIIKKQKAVIERYNKKSAKLRAELMEAEQQASTAITKEDPEMKNTDDDLVLESGRSIVDLFEVFEERTKISTPSKNLRERLKLPTGKIAKPSSAFSSEEENNVAKIIRTVIEENSRKSILLDLGNGYKSDDDMKRRCDTKIGGNPYWPKGMEWPTYKNKPMILYAQLNLGKLPKIDLLPTTGILQFFGDRELADVADFDYHSPASNGFKVVYHEKIDEGNQIDKIPASIFTVKSNTSPKIDKVYYPTAKIEEDLPNLESLGILKEVTKRYCRLVGKRYDSLPHDDPIHSLIWDTAVEIAQPTWGTRILGYGSYTQGEPSFVRGDMIQLLQIDSEKGIMWGDSGLGHFFIMKRDLARKDFSKTKFYWDCY